MKRYWLIYSYLFLFFFSSFISLYLQQAPVMADPDSFYHAKMTVLIKEGGLVKEFPWLPLTIFKDYYIDHHLLYHFLLLPFFLFFNPFLGIKISAVFFFTSAILVFYWLLRKWEIKGAFLYALVLTVSQSFLFRANLAKAGSLSLIILLFSLYALFKGKKRLLFFLSFLYVWLFDGWIILLIIFFFYLFSLIISQIILSRKVFKIIHVFYGLTGLISGIIINPYFPKNIFFYWLHIFKIGFVNYQYKIGVGGEWYPYHPLSLINDNPFVFLLLFFALLLFLFKLLSKKKEIKEKNDKLIYFFTLFLTTLFFFFFTLKSMRNVEYFIPFALLFSAFSINLFCPEIYFIKIIYFFKKYKIRVFFLLLIYSLAVFIIVFEDIQRVKKGFEQGFPLNNFQKASLWLKKNVKQGSLIFHSDWGEFPLLFYHNSRNYYIIGMDPSFMYQHDQEKYWQWVKITRGEIKENLYSIIKDNFQASYIFISQKHQKMEEEIKKEKLFQKVYEDVEAKIYQIL